LNDLKPAMPETLYSLAKAAEQAWMKVIELEKDTSLAA